MIENDKIQKQLTLMRLLNLPPTPMFYSFCTFQYKYYEDFAVCPGMEHLLLQCEDEQIAIPILEDEQSAYSLFTYRLNKEYLILNWLFPLSDGLKSTSAVVEFIMYKFI